MNKKIKEIRDYIINGDVEVCIERAKLLTDFLKREGMDYTDPFIRQAEALKYILENKKPNIFPNDLLAGSTTSKRKGVLIYPEFAGSALFPELLSMPFRKNNPYKITIEDVLELNDIFNFWEDKSIIELVRKKLGDKNESYKLHKYLFLFMVSKFTCQSHTIPNYKVVLEKGLYKIIREAQHHLTNPYITFSTTKEKNFYKGIIIAMEGVLKYAKNLHYEALQQFIDCDCNNIKRRTELLNIVSTCYTVPALPAETFFEALQSIWICMTALYQEQANVGFSIGRIDQLLNKYYVKDLGEGRITRKEALELLCHFFLKLNDNVPMNPEVSDMLFSGTGTNQAITIGGDINEVTYLCLEATEILGLRDPNVTARVNKNDPEKYTDKLVDVIINTGSTPSLYNDSTIIDMLEKQGTSKNDAKDYAIVGCVEPTSSGRTFGHTGSILISLMTPLELTLYNGNSRRERRVGLKTGTFFKDFDSFLDAFKLQTSRLITHATYLNDVCGEVYKYLHPQPLLSSIMEGCMEQGKSLLDGGAKYNSSGIAFIGLADLIDSLYVIKKLVFEKKKLTLKELVDMISDNFEHYDYIYYYIINKIDHFGNDVEEVDKIGAEIVNFIYDTCSWRMNYRGGFYNPGYWSMSIHSGFGKLSGAYPHGKRKGESFTSGLTPFSKTQKSGPTSVFNSLASLPMDKMPNGMALNMKFNKSDVKSSKKRKIFKNLFKAYFEKGGMQVQFTIHNAKDLINAKKHPEKYPDLMVRISGYTAYFKDLSEDLKDEIINRAVMKV